MAETTSYVMRHSRKATSVHLAEILEMAVAEICLGTLVFAKQTRLVKRSS